MSARVGLVIVAHSAQIARGVVELAGQMAPDVAILPAGGTADGGVGTDFDAVTRALQAADSGAGVVVLCDLGSAVMTAETARDLLETDAAARIVIADAPIVEGAVAAAVSAETGADLDTVVLAAVDARTDRGQASVLTPAAEAASGRYARTVVLVNKDGLHARPAAEFVRLAAGFDARVTVGGKDARSLLGIMSLGLVRGASVEIASEDAAGWPAVDALAELVASGFGEGHEGHEGRDQQEGRA